MADKIQQLTEELTKASLTFKVNEPLAPLTTWKIGGPADILLTVTDQEQVSQALRLANNIGVPVTFLGGGSNVLINDSGIRGLVLKNELRGITVGDQSIPDTINTRTVEPQARLQQVDTKEYYNFSELDYDESGSPRISATILSGTILAYAINNLIQKGFTGLQWFAGIPGTIGGAVLNNIHGGNHFFSEYVTSVTVIDPKGKQHVLPKEELQFAYDYSVLQNDDRFIVSVELKLHQGDQDRAQRTAIHWAQDKQKKQPYNTAGCCFKNISTKEMHRLKLISNSWGYIIDKKLGLKGHSIGGAKISGLHAAFIENTGQATASDVLALLDLIHETSLKTLGITPKTEIIFLGFETDSISKFLK